jgi:glycine/D-amino acid oxidase-like deaminating enzyme
MSLASDIDVVVIGGGIVGLSTARALSHDGRGVLVIDEGRNAGTNANAGSLHVQMQSRFLRMYPDQIGNLEYSLPLYPRAVATWQQLARDLNADFELKISGGLMVAEDAAQFAFLKEKAERERALGLDVHMLERNELMAIAPYLGEEIYGAELCVTEGKLNPLLANSALRRAVLAQGVMIATETVVSALEQRDAGYSVSTFHGEVRCKTLVLAAGAGTGALSAHLGVTIPTVAEPLHMNVTEATSPLILHLVQHAERMITLKQLGAGQVVIGGGWPARFEGPKDFPTVEPDSLIGNLSLAQHVVPRLSRLRLIRTWAGVNTTCDGQCVLGTLPGHSNAFVAVPGDAGYTLGPLVGDMTAAIIAGRDPGFDVRPFSASRFARA